MKKIKLLFTLIFLVMVISSATAVPTFLEIRPLNRTGVPSALKSYTFFYFDNENMTIQVILTENVSETGPGYVSGTYTRPDGSYQKINVTYPNSSVGGFHTYYLNYTIGSGHGNGSSLVELIAINGSGYGVVPRPFVALVNINPEDFEPGLKISASGAVHDT